MKLGILQISIYIHTALENEGSLSGTVDSDAHIFVAVFLNRLILLIEVFLTANFSAWAYQSRSDMLIFSAVPTSRCGSSALVVLARLGQRMETNLKESR